MRRKPGTDRPKPRGQELIVERFYEPDESRVRRLLELLLDRRGQRTPDEEPVVEGPDLRARASKAR